MGFDRLYDHQRIAAAAGNRGLRREIQTPQRLSSSNDASDYTTSWNIASLANLEVFAPNLKTAEVIVSSATIRYDTRRGLAPLYRRHSLFPKLCFSTPSVRIIAHDCNRSILLQRILTSLGARGCNLGV